MENKNSFEDKGIIYGIIEKYKRKSKNIPKDLNKKLKYRYIDENKIKEIEIPYIIYFDIFNQKISSLHNKLIFNMVNNLRKDYNMKKEIKILELYVNQKNNRILLKRDIKDDEGFSINPESFTDLLSFSNILETFSKENTFFVINVIITGEIAHNNIIFVEKIKNSLVFNYYEPHGFEFFLNNSFIIKFLLSLEDINTNIYINRNHKYPGIQRVTEDSFGLCIIFSLFWIYIVLNIVFYNINNKSYIPSNYWINEIEKIYVIDLNEAKGELYRIVLAFGIDLINDWFQSLSLKSLRIFLEKLDFKGTFEEVKERGIDYDIIENKRESYTKQEFEKQREQDSEITYEDWENKRKAENKDYCSVSFINDKLLKDIDKNWLRFLKTRGYKIEKGKIILGKLLGENCNDDNDCFSKKCRESYCV